MRQTKEEFANARRSMGMTAKQLAKTLRMGDSSDRTIRRYESGQIPIPGPLSVAMEALLTGFRPTQYDLED
jgi:transcriptional regulator with XRE-family HTH domain